MDNIAGKSAFPGLQASGDATPFVDHILEILEHIRLFEEFEPDEISTLARYMTCFKAPVGTEIIKEGENGDFMLLILSGTLEIIKQDSNGLPARIGTAGPGKTLGEMSVIDGEPRFASCATLTGVEFAVLDRAGLSLILSNEPRIGTKLLMQLLMLLNQRLRSVGSQLVQCMEQKARRIDQ